MKVATSGVAAAITRMVSGTGRMAMVTPVVTGITRIGMTMVIVPLTVAVTAGVARTMATATEAEMPC